MTEPPRVNGWTLYEHRAFRAQRDALIAAVERAKRDDPDRWMQRDEAKLLRTLVELTRNTIPADPADPRFRQGATLGPARKHWFRAKFGNGRYRLFFQFSSARKVIIYAWVNDSATLRTHGAYDLARPSPSGEGMGVGPIREPCSQ